MRAVNRLPGLSPVWARPLPAKARPAQQTPREVTLDLFRQDAFELTKQVRNQDLHRTLFSATMQLSHGGIPGLAGVALAKAVNYSLEQNTQAGTDDRAELINSALDLLQYSQEAHVAPLAQKAFEQARPLTDLQQADRLKANSLKSIAQLEGWNLLP